MKKFQVLAGIASVVAIASSIAIGDAASAFPCSYSKSGAAKSGSATTILGFRRLGANQSVEILQNSSSRFPRFGGSFGWRSGLHELPRRQARFCCLRCDDR
ncbi:hypothetical protein [Microcoleus vaginatus]|uniref:hypothetical protein n=1 Tax=Microcoleus vaginatus TaxID=119532 RepID=UPI00403F6509